VLISKSPCPLFERRLTGKKQAVVFEVDESCDLCNRCLDELGCSAFVGRKMPRERPLFVSIPPVQRVQCLLPDLLVD